MDKADADATGTAHELPVATPQHLLRRGRGVPGSARQPHRRRPDTEIGAVTAPHLDVADQVMDAVVADAVLHDRDGVAHQVVGVGRLRFRRDLSGEFRQVRQS
ncbi:hypothetical protein [Nonomuraea roseoviolacea]|uniref:hypothetical protein n=1 Tax=Nonomuraea roseoviolacea TaxID=103837 RepID=UPI0020A24EB1|nr:hypothetical protein [Nonomuraea roseoviolacea]